MRRLMAVFFLWWVGVAPTYAATIRVTAPSNGATYTPPASMTVQSVATATLDGEELTSHRLYRNGTLIASASISTDLSHTLSTTQSGLASGTYQFTSKVTNSAGTTYTSSVVTITVNAPPSVSLTAPSNGASYTAPATITLTASASDSDGTISKVEFFNGSTLLATDTSAPYSYTWSGVAGSASAYALKARATDNLGGVTDSAISNVTVNALPSVSLSRSPSWSSMVSPAAITLNATASDSDGSISKVEFYQGSSLLATDTSSPYSHSLSLTNGSYSFTAKAYDNRGAVTTSAANTLTVTVPASGPGSATRRYVYDAYQRLCKVIEPETGSTVMDYDAAGNLAWSAAGLALPSTTSCDTAHSSVAARKVARSYDARNRLSALAFPDGVGNQTWIYTADGLPASITTNNTPGGTQAINTYSYNRRRLLTRERLQFGTVDWPIDTTYTANGHLASQIWNGLTVAYAPNALGQPTQAGSFASGVSYFPNGAIKQFTYGNSIVHTLAQNARGLPDTSRDAYGATDILNDGYDYDANSNVAAISDGLAGARGNRTMSYDALDRLKTVTSPMYGSTGANYSYDALDNLTRVTIGGTAARDHWYCYDAANHLTNVKVNDCGGASVIGLGYDVQGNVDNKNGVTHTFDYGNRLRSVGTSPVSTYAYDGHGRRVRDTTSGDKYSLYALDGRLVLSSDARAGKISEYIYLGGSLVAIRERDTTTGAYTTKYQHTDALGSPVAVTDASRNVIERTEYEPYGKVLNRPIHDGPSYTGHVEDAATGLLYAQQRYMDRELERFISVDPVSATSVGGNFNRYWYAANNPYRYFDPDGRQQRFCAGSRVCLSETALNKKLDELNAESGKIAHTSVKKAANYFAAKAIPLQERSGREIGANMEGRSPTDFRVVDFHADSGAGAENAVSTQAYSGMFSWVAILHTHPSSIGLSARMSGIGAYAQNGRFHYVGLTDEHDIAESFRRNVDGILVLPDMSMRMFDVSAWKEAGRASGEEKVYAADFEVRF